MSDPNFIRIDVSGGWLDQLIKEIDKNRDFSISCANRADLSEEDRYNYKCMAERDARVKAKVTKYTDSQGYARLYRRMLKPNSALTSTQKLMLYETNVFRHRNLMWRTCYRVSVQGLSEHRP